MTHISIGVQRVRRVDSDLVVTIPDAMAEVLGIGEGDEVEVFLQPSAARRSALRPEVRAAADAVLPIIEPGLRYLADK